MTNYIIFSPFADALQWLCLFYIQLYAFTQHVSSDILLRWLPFNLHGIHEVTLKRLEIWKRLKRPLNLKSGSKMKNCINCTYKLARKIARIYRRFELIFLIKFKAEKWNVNNYTSTSNEKTCALAHKYKNVIANVFLFAPAFIISQ